MLADAAFRAGTLAALVALISTSLPPAHAGLELVTDTTRFRSQVAANGFGYKGLESRPLYKYGIELTSQNLDPGAQITATNYRSGYGFGSNGFWNSSMGMTGLNSNYGDMDFTFSNGPVYGAGGFINYVPESLGSMEITALDSDKNVLKSWTLDFLTGGGTNSGAFYYVLSSKPEIKTLRLSRSFAAITELSFDPGVPGPLPLLGVAAGFGFSRKLRRRISSKA